jgi:uncharacterized membrane protein
MSSTLPQSRSYQRLIYLALLALLATGLLLRVWNINFDQGVGSHPDERSTVCFYAPTIGWPTSAEQFWNPQQSPLNPLWDRVQQQRRGFTYGHFPLYLGVGMGHLFHALAPTAERLGAGPETVALLTRANRACDGFAVAGRLTIALLDTFTILLLFWLTRRLFGAGFGLLAAALYTFTAQAVQLSHFFAMDPASTTFTVLAVLGGVKMVQERRLGAAVLTGVGAGLAISSKFSALPVLAVPVTATVLWWVVAAHEGEGEAARSRLRALVGGALALLVALLAFALTSPYAILDRQNFIQVTLVEQGQMVRGVADFPFTRQYRNTTPYLYFIEQQVQWGMGRPLGLWSLAGTLVAALWLVQTLAALLVDWWRGRVSRFSATSPALGLVLAWSWVVPYFGLTGAFLAKFNRYMSPVLPFAILFGVALLWLMARWAQTARRAEGYRRRLGQVAQGAVVVVAVVLVSSAAFWSAAYVHGVYGREHTWITASRWLYTHAPRGSVILWELWDDALPKSIPGEAGMDMGSTGLSNSDWSPYEEDTAEKFEILKEKLRGADFVVYSSKRIYDSVDELPERYPMTNLYYDAMWDGRLGFELAAEFTAPPQLFGWVFDDRDADESWSLYDHPQVTVFRKVRDLSDAEYNALFGRIWETAIPYYRGADSPLSPLLELLGLGGSAGSGNRGLISGLIGLMAGGHEDAVGPSLQTESKLLVDRPLAALPVVDNYRWNTWASDAPLLAALMWWAVLAFLGWVVWPLTFGAFAAFPDRGYLLSRTLGWLLAAWLLWIGASGGLLHNNVRTAWGVVLGLTLAGGVAAWRQRGVLMAYLRARWGLIAAAEGLFVGAFAAFLVVRMFNPDLWQPWYGGEKFMEFAFLNGILRSPTFPPVDPHFAGGVINYYYYGIYLVAFLIKLTGIYAEVAFNLAIATLFALTFANAFAVALAAWQLWRPTWAWRHGVGAALFAPLFVALLGNLDGFAQIFRRWMERSTTQFESALPGVEALVHGINGWVQVVQGNGALPPYEFWWPSRVIPYTINEFPYWSFLFADLHPHLIGIPVAVLFIGVMLAILGQYGPQAGQPRRARLLLLAVITFLLGTLASINLWELPTYFGLGVLLLLVAEYRARGSIRLGRVVGFGAIYLLGALLTFWPFFANYVNIGASGIGWVREGDDLGTWLLVWGGLGFFVACWLWWRIRRAGRARLLQPDRKLSGVEPVLNETVVEATDATTELEISVTDLDEVDAAQWAVGDQSAGLPGQGGVDRFVGMALRRMDRLPRFWYLHQRLVTRPTLGYLLGVALVPLLLVGAVGAWLLGREVLALCLVLFVPALPLLWQGEAESDSGDLLMALLIVTGLAILAGTQVVYLKDFLGGGEWYRMNTLFKFFVQTWVLWGMAGALALPRLWAGVGLRLRSEPRVDMGAEAVQDIVHEPAGEAPAEVVVEEGAPPSGQTGARTEWLRGRRVVWQVLTVLVLAASFTYVVVGTPARVQQRLVGWRPPFGTLNGLDFMNAGSYTWPTDANRIEMRDDVEAIRWLLAHVRGNAVIVESAEVDYYRAGGTRVASMTGLSGLRGLHSSEQRFGEQVGARESLHREFWETSSPERTLELLRELQGSLIYVGALERQQHPEGVAKLAEMAAAGSLDVLYENPGAIIYGVPGRLVLQAGGWYVPAAGPSTTGVSPELRDGETGG